MIDFEKEFIKAWGKAESSNQLTNRVGSIWFRDECLDFICSKLLQQIEEDNKRFLGMIGEDEKDPNPPETFEREEYGVISGKSVRNLKRYLENNNNWESRRGRNQLRQELRDKLKGK